MLLLLVYGNKSINHIDIIYVMNKTRPVKEGKSNVELIEDQKENKRSYVIYDWLGPNV